MGILSVWVAVRAVTGSLSGISIFNSSNFTRKMEGISNAE